MSFLYFFPFENPKGGGGGNFRLTNSSGFAMLALSAGKEEWPDTETAKIPTARRTPQPIAWWGGGGTAAAAAPDWG